MGFGIAKPAASTTLQDLIMRLCPACHRLNGVQNGTRYATMRFHAGVND
jgi:hypothetical protein